LICRRIVPAGARPCPPIPPLNLHGKEGVDGSSPSEGSAKAPQTGIVVSVVPILLGGGARLFENVGDAKLEQVESVEAPGVTHIRYAGA
jgi:hypothetical protein